MCDDFLDKAGGSDNDDDDDDDKTDESDIKEEKEKKKVLLVTDDGWCDIAPNLEKDDVCDWDVNTNLSTKQILESMEAGTFQAEAENYHCVMIMKGLQELIDLKMSTKAVASQIGKIASGLSGLKCKVVICQTPPVNQNLSEFATLNERIKKMKPSSENVTVLCTLDKFKPYSRSKTLENEDDNKLSDLGARCGADTLFSVTRILPDFDIVPSKPTDQVQNDIKMIKNTLNVYEFDEPNVKHVVGKGGNQIRYIEKVTGAEASVAKWTRFKVDHYGVVIKGNENQVKSVMKEVDKIVNDNNQQRTVCKFFAQGKCRDGKKCTWSHEQPTAKRQKQK